MNKRAIGFIVLLSAFLFLTGVTVQAQGPTLVDDWGKNSNATAWPILNTAATPAGAAGIGNGVKPTGWSSIRGGFDAVQATAGNAVIVSGQLELVGGGGASGYTHLRYALTFIDSTALQSQYTDSAKWVETGVLKHYGYEFCPVSGTGIVSNGAWGVGTQGVIKNGNWNSTNSNGGPALGTTKQAPRNAEMVAGIYNWAISVQPLADGTNEVRWFMVEQNNKYWYGGSMIDTMKLTPKFNGISFGFNNDQSATQVNFLAVQVDMGPAIEVPEAPWEPFYVNQWGKNPNAMAWPVLNDSTYLDGDAGLGNGVKPTGWSSIRGGFGDAIQATLDKAMIVSGQMELVGGGGASGYTHLRYALTFIDSTTLQYQYTDSARWKDAVLTKHFGYEFCPVSGTGIVSNGAWGVGTQGVIKNGNWNSTNSNGGPALGTTKQAPRNAEMVAGIYNWAISVQPLADGTNEVRWFMVEQNNKYWYGGSMIDTMKLTPKFNGISFGFNNDQSATQVNFLAVQVDMGPAIEVPEAPWEPFYVNQWGKNPNAMAWPVLNDSTYLDGDAGLGNGVKPTGWSSIRGGFGDAIQATLDKAMIVSGQMELVGGGGASGYTHLRYALTFIDSTTLQYQYTDSARWKDAVLTKHFGYEFCPVSGTGIVSNGAWGVGTQGVIKNGNWNSTNSNGGPALGTTKQAPRNAEMVAGIYNWAISVQPLADGTNEVRWFMVEQNNKYWYGGSMIDTMKLTPKFNGISFGFNNDQSATQVNFLAVQVDMGPAIEVPEAPWEPFYVNQWGKNPNAMAWPVLNDSTYLDGDAGLGNGVKPTGWSSIRGGFGDAIQATLDKAIIVKGQMELVGGGGASGYTHLRYALTFIDSTTLQYQYTDSARWKDAVLTKHFGYEFCPVSGTGTISNGAWGVGTQGVIKNGNWNSTNSNGGPALGTTKQAPRNAEMVAGIYNWAISVQPLADGTNEVRWFMVEQNNKYWYGGSMIDTMKLTPKFNGISFGFNNDQEATQVNFMAVQVDMGDPIVVPAAPWAAFYVTDWGFIGNRFGGWKFKYGDFDGDATISGTTAPTSWAALRGGFGIDVKPNVDSALVVTGKIELVGGGFEAWSSLRFGVFQADSAGTLISTRQDSMRWSGLETHHHGYLFLPESGTNGIVSWAGSGQSGTYGGVVDASWISTNGANNYVLGSALQEPKNALGGAGIYNFAISVQPQSDGKNEIRFSLIKSDSSYIFASKAIDGHDPLATDIFNGVAFAINNGTTTAMNLQEVMVDLGDPIELPDWVTAVELAGTTTIPDQYALMQNYPNPFNPTTTIAFDLPQDSEVSLVVYDLSGRIVAQLATGKLKAGNHTVMFDAASLASGMYFYKMKTENYTSVRKLMLLK